MKKWLATFAAYKLIVLGMAFAAIALVPKIWPTSLGHFCLLFYQWDARNVLMVARDGYLSFEPSMQVFPIVPWLFRLFHLFIRHWEIAGMAATQVASFFAFYYLYKLARLDLEERAAVTALALFALFPTAYFLTAPYTEAAFCALSFGAVYYVRTGRFAAAAAFAFLAAACRYTGFLLGPAVFVQWLAHRKTYSRKQTQGLALVSVAALGGFGLYLVLNKVLHGNWLYYMEMQKKFWSLGISWPFKGAVAAIKAWGARTPDQRISIIIFEIGFTAVALALLVPVYRQGRARRQLIDFTYMALSLLVLLLMPFWLSRPRYVLTLYPMFLVAAPWFARSLLGFSLYALGSAGLFGLYWGIYLNAQWAH